MPKKICDMDCFNCIFDDCKYDGSQIAKEGLMLRNAGCPTDKELKAKEPKGKTKTKPYTEKQKEYKRQYAIKNKERIKEYKKKYYEEHKDEFDSDVIIVADSGNWSAEIPSLTTSLRGNTDIDVHVKALHHPVHSGQYGGPILDANTLAAMLIVSMYDEHGDLAVPGVASEDPIGGLQRDMDETTVRTDAGIVDSYRLAGTGSLAARLWTKPSVTVIGFDAHPVEESFNVISPETTFRLSLRTAPNQRPEEAQEALAAFMVEHAPFGAEVWVDKLDNGMGWAMDPNAEATKDAMEAMEEAFGVAPVNKGEGGSIPFIPELQRIFPKAQVLVTGPEDPKANAHSPNESISLPSLKNNVITEALLLDKLAK